MSGPHNALVQAEFTRQAQAYAANPLISDSERIARLVGVVSPARDARVLEVACGPGYVAAGFAEVCREVIGLDLTDAPLALAARMALERGLANVTFRGGDAEHLPFGDGEFDVAVSRLAFHHFERPASVL